jgi:hypothetical protein
LLCLDCDTIRIAVQSAASVQKAILIENVSRRYVYHPSTAGVARESIARNEANTPQQSWGFEREPPEAVMKDLGILVREMGFHEDAGFRCI